MEYSLIIPNTLKGELRRNADLFKQAKYLFENNITDFKAHVTELENLLVLHRKVRLKITQYKL